MEKYFFFNHKKKIISYKNVKERPFIAEIVTPNRFLGKKLILCSCCRALKKEHTGIYLIATIWIPKPTVIPSFLVYFQSAKKIR
jgi:hypothetical protein